MRDYETEKETRREETGTTAGEESAIEPNLCRSYSRSISTRKAGGEAMKIIEPETKTRKHFYSKAAREFADGRNGYHEQTSYIYDNDEPTGIAERAKKISHDSRWTFSYTYKGKEYSSLQEAIQVYEREVDNEKH